MVVLVSPFREHTADASSVSDLHARAVQDDLEACTALDGVIDVRRLPSHASGRDAERIMKVSKAHVMITGNARVAAGTARWSPTVLMRWHSQHGSGFNMEIHDAGEEFRAAEARDLEIEPGVALTGFTERDLGLNHGKALRGLALTLAGLDGFADPDQCYAEALAVRSEMPTLGRALLSIGIAYAKVARGGSRVEDLMNASRALIQAAQDDAGDPYIWVEIQSFAAHAENVGAPLTFREPIARQAVHHAPNDGHLRYSFAGALLAKATYLYFHEGDVGGAQALCREGVDQLREADRLGCPFIPPEHYANLDRQLTTGASNPEELWPAAPGAYRGLPSGTVDS
jgi:hypothetical protein